MTYLLVAVISFIAGAYVAYSSGYEAGFNDQDDESYTDRICA